MSGAKWLSAVVLVVAGVASARDAEAAPKDQKQCADAYLEAQKTRKSGALLEAKKQLEICAASKCLAAVKKECGDWMTEVENEIPTVVVKFAGADVTFTIDGAAHAGGSDAPIPLDPGSHSFVFTQKGGTTAKRDVTLKSGEKGVVVEAFPPAAAPVVSMEPPPEPPKSRSKILPLALVGVGVVSLGGMTAFWLRAKSKQETLDEAGCAPNCTDKSVGIITRNRLLGDIALGVGIVSLGAAAYLFFSSPKDSAATQAKIARGEIWPFVF